MRREAKMAILVAVAITASSLPSHPDWPGTARPAGRSEVAIVSELVVPFTLAGFLCEVGHGHVCGEEESDGMASGVARVGTRSLDAEGGSVNRPPSQVAPYEPSNVWSASVEGSRSLALTEGDVDAIYEAAQVPPEWRADLKAIARCESSRGTAYWQADAVGDGGNSLGLHQLNWATWFPYALGLGLVEESDLPRWADPVVNTRVAIAVTYYDRGRGYPLWKQWTCQP